MSLFAALAAIAGTAPAAEKRAIETPTWISKPTAEDLARFYPADSQHKNREGVATISCDVIADGHMGPCTVVREYPAGAGFGEATLKLAPLFQMSATTSDGTSVEGGTVRLPIRWLLPGSPLIGFPEVDTVAACYGQLANRAQANAEDLEAWRGAMYWSAKMISVAARRYGTPSQVENSMIRAREAAANGTLNPKSGYDLAACVKALPKP